MKLISLRVLVAALSIALVGCSGGGDKPLALDGSPRYPDDQGIATEASRDGILLDGDRRYKVSPELKSFSTYTLETIPLSTRIGQYVQVGLKGKTVVWIAGIAAVVPSKPPRVFYIGELKKVDGPHAVFADGTVLRLAKALRSSAKPANVTAVIDPEAHEVIELRGAR